MILRGPKRPQEAHNTLQGSPRTGKIVKTYLSIILAATLFKQTLYHFADLIPNLVRKLRNQFLKNRCFELLLWLHV